MRVNAQQAASKRKLIAIVEDDANLVTMFRDMLERTGRWQLHIRT